MDEEASFANLLAQSSTASRPQWGTSGAAASPADDPWANPFAAPGASSTSSANPFGAAPGASLGAGFGAFDASTGFGSAAAAPGLDNAAAVGVTVSPYVQRLENDERQGLGTLPDPPSVLAARDAEAYAQQAQTASSSGTGYLQDGFGATDAQRAFAPIESPTLANDPFAQPFAPPAPFGRPASPPPNQSGFDIHHAATSASSPPSRSAAAAPRSKALPSDLIDDDLLAASDPSLSLKKAFVKTTTTTTTAKSGPSDSAKQGKTGSAAPTPEKPKPYVFRPGGAAGAARRDSAEFVKKAVSTGTAAAAAKPTGDAVVSSKDEKSQAESSSTNTRESRPADEPSDENGEAAPSTVVTAPTPAATETDGPRLGDDPASVPLPPSAMPTPAGSRSTTPQPSDGQNTAADHSAARNTSNAERSMRDLSIAAGHSGQSSTAAPTLEPIADPMSTSGWTSSLPTASTSQHTPGSSRFGGKGWGSLDEDDQDDDGGLFGKGGPSLRVAVPPPVWETGAQDDGGEGWGGENVAFQPAVAAPLNEPEPPASAAEEDDPEETAPLSAAVNGGTRKKSAVFQVAVSDPAKVGDPVRGYTVYTVRTRTTSPHYRRSDFSVLRRFSDFLWLWDALTTNNPGIIVPPMPDKNALGRFQEQFIETRRAALQRSLSKITSHPVLQLDPDLRLFLESDTFASEIKHRPKPETAAMAEKQGLLAGWTGTRFVEQDEWYDSRKQFLDSLEAQLKALSKAVDAASKARLEIALSIEFFADSITALAESDLGSAMCAALARLADLARKEKENNEEQAKADVVQVLNVADEYIRTIGSVRLAFAGRVKAYHAWQSSEKEVVRLRQVREKARQQGKLGDRVQSSLAEIVEAERRTRDAATEFDTISRLVKSEFGRFERERIEDFRDMLQAHLDGQVGRQKELIAAWEEHHALLLAMVKRAQVPAGQAGGSGM